MLVYDVCTYVDFGDFCVFFVYTSPVDPMGYDAGLEASLPTDPFFRVEAQDQGARIDQGMIARPEHVWSL